MPLRPENGPANPPISASDLRRLGDLLRKRRRGRARPGRGGAEAGAPGEGRTGPSQCGEASCGENM